MNSKSIIILFFSLLVHLFNSLCITVFACAVFDEDLPIATLSPEIMKFRFFFFLRTTNILISVKFLYILEKNNFLLYYFRKIQRRPYYWVCASENVNISVFYFSISLQKNNVLNIIAFWESKLIILKHYFMILNCTLFFFID